MQAVIIGGSTEGQHVTTDANQMSQSRQIRSENFTMLEMLTHLQPHKHFFVPAWILVPDMTLAKGS